MRPVTARRIKPRSVVCPDCGAQVDQRCINKAGEPFAASGVVHASRRRIATRRDNESRGL